MMMDELDSLRRWVVGLIIAVAVAMACGRIVSTQLVYEPALHRNAEDPGTARVWPKQRPRPMPTFSSNDRSRWATVRALVDEGTYVVGRRDLRTTLVSAATPFGQLDPLAAVTLVEAGFQRRITSDSGIIFEDGWQSVDKVLNPNTQEYYSSKPPLLSTLVAGLYWLLEKLSALGYWLLSSAGYYETSTHWTLGTHPAEVVRTLLLCINALPFLIYLVLLARVAKDWGHGEAGQLYIVTAGAFATLVTPFLITFNNHTVATFSVMAAWYTLLKIWRQISIATWETPAWSLYIAAGFFSAFAVCNELPALAFAVAVFLLLLWYRPGPTLCCFLPAALVPAIAFFATNYAALGQLRPAYSEFGSTWYLYEGSHWRKVALGLGATGIDFARNHETRATYAFHVLLGHHGLLSLAPIWLLSLGAMVMGTFRPWWRRAFHPTGVAPGEFPWFVQPLGLALTVVVIGFYLVETSGQNYSGWSNGLRWLMWLAPIWLTCMLPVAEQLACCRRGRVIGYVFLALSVFAVHYQLWNPWRHPWLYDFMQECGWPGY
jgi:hypothetical protein